VGFVVIGRNEGERLRRCLARLPAADGMVVYVDSGSTDGSREVARAAGALVEELDAARPYTAARARNAGFERLRRAAPGSEFVQFVDGDCELRDGWVEAGLSAMRRHDDVAVVCGRNRERHPEASVYNRLCDVEWDTPVGEARECGGNALVRAAAFQCVGGFEPTMIAGEEPDLCLRLRRLGHRILRLDAEMTRHDAAMTRASQWAKRAVRTGHATAGMLWKHGPSSDHGRMRRAASAVCWAIALPLAWIALAVASDGWDAPARAVALLAPALAYAVLAVRVVRTTRRRGCSMRDARAYAVSCVLAKWPETWGMLVHLARRATRRDPRWIDYKDAAGDGPTASPREAAGSPAPTVKVKRRLRATVDRAARWSGLLARRERGSADGLTVLMYHRVLEDADCADYPFPSLVMPVSAFREQVEWLAGRGEVVPLAEALRRLGRGDRRTAPLYSLTFDDGYSDAREIASGVLEDAGVRGTFFVTTGFVGSPDMLWFDRAAALFARLPDDARRRVVPAGRGGIPRAGLPGPGSTPGRWAAALKLLPPGERDAVLAALEDEAGATPSADGFRALTVEQLVDLHRRGHEIGSHTRSHPILPGLDDEALRLEIVQARRTLSGWLGVDVPGFCYPNGDHDARVVGEVGRAGHAYACTTLDGIHRQGDDPYRIRRVGLVWDRVVGGTRAFDATAFRRELCGLYRRRDHARVQG
jgi:peptidoglycan/xylan/chitin deacetylase (PgdA/CDA1 family)/GT2 family glycosyltransferase